MHKYFSSTAKGNFPFAYNRIQRIPVIFEHQLTVFPSHRSQSKDIEPQETLATVSLGQRLAQFHYLSYSFHSDTTSAKLRAVTSLGSGTRHG